jgi:hypothetical protein
MKSKKQIRIKFKNDVFHRDNGLCVICCDNAIDAHHILDRSLWPDGGYHVDNGVSLCADDHIKAEAGEWTPKDLRKAARITKILLPPQFDPEFSYNKWGEKSYIL